MNAIAAGDGGGDGGGGVCVLGMEGFLLARGRVNPQKRLASPWSVASIGDSSHSTCLGNRAAWPVAWLQPTAHPFPY